MPKGKMTFKRGPEKPKRKVPNRINSRKIRLVALDLVLSKISAEKKILIISNVPNIKSKRIRESFYRPLFTLLRKRGNFNLRYAAAKALLEMKAPKSFNVVTSIAIKTSSSKLAIAVIERSTAQAELPFLLRLISKHPFEHIKFQAAEAIPWIATPRQIISAIYAINSLISEGVILRKPGGLVKTTINWNLLLADLKGTAIQRDPSLAVKK